MNRLARSPQDACVAAKTCRPSVSTGAAAAVALVQRLISARPMVRALSYKRCRAHPFLGTPYAVHLSFGGSPVHVQVASSNYLPAPVDKLSLIVRGNEVSRAVLGRKMKHCHQFGIFDELRFSQSASVDLHISRTHCLGERYIILLHRTRIHRMSRVNICPARFETWENLFLDKSKVRNKSEVDTCVVSD